MGFLRLKIVTCLKSLKCCLNNKMAPVVRDITYFLHSHSENSIFFRGLYYVQKFVLKLKPLTPFKIINHRFYSELHISSTIQPFITGRLGYTSNLIYNMEPKDFSLMPIELPDVYVFKHENVRIQGDSDFVIDVEDNYAVNDFSYNMNSRYENIDGVLFCQKENLALLKYDGKRCERTIESGIMLSGKFSQNYYHEMYEIMVKLLILEKIQISEDVPLIVDEIVFHVNSFKQLFETLNRSNRKIEAIGANEMVEFGTLYCFSAVNIIPPNRKYINDASASEIIFDIAIIRRMRERLLAVKSERYFPARIFLSRKNTKNRNYNEDEVILLVKRYGFSVVIPENYDLFDQMALFNGADCIIGASGAAFSNILFCRKGCKIICLQPRRLNIPAFTTIAYGLDDEMRYCLGTPDGSDLHSSYRVDLVMLELMLNNFIEPKRM
jgi:hypothetical protein